MSINQLVNMLINWRVDMTTKVNAASRKRQEAVRCFASKFHKTNIERLATQNKIQKAMRRIPGRKDTLVYHPDDIEAIRARTAQLEPFQVGARETPEGLAPARHNGGVELPLQLFSNSGASAPAATAPRHKLFLTLKEAADYSGMLR